MIELPQEVKDEFKRLARECKYKLIVVLVGLLSLVILNHSCSTANKLFNQGRRRLGSWRSNAKPGSVRQNLVAHWTIMGANSPELDLSGNGNSGTVTGTSTVNDGALIRSF